MNKHTLIGKALVIAFISLVAVSAASAKNKKYGLFVGINAYTGGISQLRGCVNDATKMREAMISKFGFKATDTTLLTDAAATREGILTNLKKYQAAAGVGDILVFHYSGHGTLFPDAYSEEQDETKLIYMEAPNDEGVIEVVYERDKYDSAIVPVDAGLRTSGKPWRNLILDDELYAIFSAVTRKGAQVVLISDSCHSGSIDRPLAVKDVQQKTQALAKVFGVRKFSELDLEKSGTTNAARTPPPAKGLYLAMTGSKDDEFSLDATINGTPMGLFTSKLLANMPPAPAPRRPIRMTYEQLMTPVKVDVAKQARIWENNQNPQLNTEFGNPKMTIFSVPAAR